MEAFYDFFAASNSGKGFQNYFPVIFNADNLNKIYIIKGGPGSGKSTLMKKIAKRAAENGSLIERYFCSSDPHSLDGIIIWPQKIAVLDGTSPHLQDPKYPGAVEEIINTGIFFRTEALQKNRDKIARLGDQKSRLYRIVYRYLSAAAEIQQALDEALKPSIKTEKLRKAVSRVYSKIKTERGTADIRFTEAISTDGYIHLPTLQEAAHTKISVYDKYQTGTLFLTELAKLAKQDGIKCTICPNPLSDQYINEIIIGDTVFFLSNDKKPANAERTVNMERFIHRETVAKKRHSIKYLLKCYHELISGALQNLAEIKTLHGELEEIYIHSMDFDSLNAYSEEKIAEILK